MLTFPEYAQTEALTYLKWIFVGSIAALGACAFMGKGRTHLNVTKLYMSFLQAHSDGGVHFTPDNIQYYASYLHSSVDIQDRVIHIGTGSAKEKLLEVPIGHIDPHDTIIITVGLNKSHPNTPSVDSDPQVAISDGSNTNGFELTDVGNYAVLPPCYVVSGVHDDERVSATAQTPSTFKLTFTPFFKYGACETAQDGGFINTGRFNTQIDVGKLLYLTVFRNHAAENMYFHYFNVQIFQKQQWRTQK